MHSRADARGIQRLTTGKWPRSYYYRPRCCTTSCSSYCSSFTWWIELIMHCAVQVKCSHWSCISSSSKSIRTLYTHCKLSIVQYCCRITHWPVMIPKLLQRLHINPGSQSKHLQDQNQSSAGEWRKLRHWMLYMYIHVNPRRWCT